MATFVLVHGAMHGGWCWRDVHRLLSQRGHDVHCPTLSGQGDRRSGLSPEVGVDAHVGDLDELLWFEDLSDVHLVLHSYAGVLAGPLAERTEERLSSVVFLGAFVTAPGQSLLDVEPPEVAERYRRQVGEAGEGWFVPASDAFLTQWGIDDPAQRAWVGARLTDFPFRCQIEPTQFDPAPLDRLRKVYVAHTDPPLASLGRFAEAAVAAGWETHELACGHDMMLAAPAETADLLERIALG
ncbi:MAG TPA: alpha/beta fold hydrolase [Acidimicrobiales bacterium]|nr:alpha/beta fold hydrolase [Acidimicrobiales bacterium]